MPITPLGPEQLDSAEAALHVKFRDKDVLAAYGPHPEHKAVQGILGPIVKTLWVVDFEPS